MFKLIGAAVVFGFATYGLISWWREIHEVQRPNDEFPSASDESRRAARH